MLKPERAKIVGPKKAREGPLRAIAGSLFWKIKEKKKIGRKRDRMGIMSESLLENLLLFR